MTRNEIIKRLCEIESNLKDLVYNETYFYEGKTVCQTKYIELIDELYTASELCEKARERLEDYEETIIR